MSDTEHMSELEVLKAENNRYYAFVNLALILAAVTGIELVLVYLPFPTTLIFTVLISLSLFKFDLKDYKDYLIVTEN